MQLLQSLTVVSDGLREFLNSGLHDYTGVTHGDVSKLKHLLRYWPFVRGIYRSPVNSPQKGQWRRAWKFSLICAWVNNREAGDLRRHRPHYEVSVMLAVNYTEPLRILVNIGEDNGLLPDKVISWVNGELSSEKSSGIHLGSMFSINAPAIYPWYELVNTNAILTRFLPIVLIITYPQFLYTSKSS